MISQYPLVKMGQFLKLRKEFFLINDSEKYRLATVQIHSKGIRERSRLLGIEIKTKKQQRIKAGELLVAEIDAKVGGFGVVPPDLDGAIVSGHYFLYEIDQNQVTSEYLDFYLKTGYPEQDLQQFVKGSVNYAAIRSQHFSELEIPLPSLKIQFSIVEKLFFIQRRIEEINILQITTEKRIREVIQSLISSSVNESDQFTQVNLSKVLIKMNDLVSIDDNQTYSQVTVHMHNQGLSLRKECLGKEIKTKKQYRIREGQFVFSKIDARNGAMGLVPSELDGAIVSNDFPAFVPDSLRLHPEFFNHYSSSEPFVSACIEKSKGTSNRRRLNERDFLQITIPLPSYERQLWVVSITKRLEELRKWQELIKKETEGLFKSILDRAFRGEFQ
jgi:type I restriction enzyme, S subunit